ncbi:amino acid kinase family protein [Actinoallomurus rhizosphaericola]|uniref:amino acid kinase family protein n=1 Tax=Actinoallomurus rhizosphaericola TaxID=2952536 RepID=UPI002091511E|nr:hypothetical protein [Actinoallomurus rhizosphaericola]MCO5993968.1 hypothetical protein [Actinoallomurus rhizosphaericola]
MTIAPRYRRLVLKVSGESLGSRDAPLDPERMGEVAQSVAAIRAMGVVVTLIVGGGNIYRGAQATRWHLDRPQADAVGMAATAVNALLLDGMLDTMGVPAHIFARGPASGSGNLYHREEVRSVLARNEVVILAGGMGVSGFSTDVPAVHAAIDTMADVIVMAKHGVDGIYEKDPRRHSDARFLPSVTASEALRRNLRIMDASALTLARDHGKTIHVVGAADPNAVKYAVEGKEIGSIVQPL